MTVKQLYEAFNFFDKNLDLELNEKGPGDIEYRLTVARKHLSSPGVGHGGVIAAMMDAVIGTTALSQVFHEKKLVSTIEFKINYFKPILEDDILIGSGEIEFQGKSIIACSGKISKLDSGELVSKSLGTFNIYPMEKRGLKLDLEQSS